MARSRLTTVAAALGLCLSPSACGDDSAGIETLPGVEITVTPADLILPIGQRARLTATVTDLEGRPLEGREIRWSSSAPAIAEVSSSGVVRALDYGSAAIGAYSEQGVGFALVRVQLEFAVPVSGRWLVVSEIGTLSPACPGQEGGLRVDGGWECRHSGSSRYSLDLADEAQWLGSAGGSPPPVVVAAAEGTITDICIQPPTEVTCGANGPFVMVDHPGGYRSIYAHLDPNSVTLRRKTPVSRGQPLGVMGQWGNDPAPWLHFELRYENEGAREARVLEAVRLSGKSLREYRAGDVSQP